MLRDARDVLTSLVPVRFWVRGCRNPGRCDHSPVFHHANLTRIGKWALGVRR